MKVYEAAARAFHDEGVDTCFHLVGDGNAHWADAMDRLPGMRTFHVRHEHCAVMMAEGYASATGRVGVASVTCGPGFTQLTTALASAARDRLPMVIFAGETPVSARWHIQHIEQQPLAAAAGVPYLTAHSPSVLHHRIQEAFYVARAESRPVVLGIPYDVQAESFDPAAPYVPASRLVPSLAPIAPDAEPIARLADKLASARLPLILAGRGALLAEAEGDLRELAEASGALLGSTLRARGIFDSDPYSLGVIGGFSRAIAREMAAQADLVVAVGASLSNYTWAGGRMFAQAAVVQVDTAPIGRRQGLRTADDFVRGDARLAARALIEQLRGRTPRSQARTAALADRIRSEPADDAIFPDQPGTIDPRALFAALEEVLPKDFDGISGSGHQAYFHSVMRGYDPRRYHCLREFGAIGNALSSAVGVAIGRGNSGRVVLFEGDGGLLMNIQEFETIRRHGIKLLIVVCNDGAFGSEIHTLQSEGMDDRIARFGHPDFPAIARGFGLRGVRVGALEELPALYADYAAGDTAMVWDVHVNDRVVSPPVRLGIKRAD